MIPTPTAATIHRPAAHSRMVAAACDLLLPELVVEPVAPLLQLAMVMDSAQAASER